MANKSKAQPKQGRAPQIQQGPDLFIKNEELVQLDRIIDQIPTQYGKYFLQFFSAVHQKRAAEALAAKNADKTQGK